MLLSVCLWIQQINQPILQEFQRLKTSKEVLFKTSNYKLNLGSI